MKIKKLLIPILGIGLFTLASCSQEGSLSNAMDNYSAESKYDKDEDDDPIYNPGDNPVESKESSAPKAEKVSFNTFKTSYQNAWTSIKAKDCTFTTKMSSGLMSYTYTGRYDKDNSIIEVTAFGETEYYYIINGVVYCNGEVSEDYNSIDDMILDNISPYNYIEFLASSSSSCKMSSAYYYISDSSDEYEIEAELTISGTSYNSVAKMSTTEVNYTFETTVKFESVSIKNPYK